MLAHVLANFADDITLDELAALAGLTRYNFCRRFQRACGLPPIRWLWNFRTMLAATFMDLDPSWSLTDVAFACGFASSSHFSRTFKQMYGMSPSDYRRRCQEQLLASGLRLATSAERKSLDAESSLVRTIALRAMAVSA